MSARDDLLREMTHNHLYMDDERANELIDAFARELAEEIRSERDDMNIPCSPATPDTIAGMDYAANLIDPQGHEGVRLDEEPTP